MSYLTRQDFVNHSISSAAVSGLSDDQIDEILAWASREADGYLKKRYKLPLTEWSSDLKTIVGDLAQFRVLSFRGFRPGSGHDDIVVKRYDDAINKLRDISRGIVELVGAVDSTPSVDEEGPLVARAEQGKFSWNTRR